MAHKVITTQYIIKDFNILYKKYIELLNIITLHNNTNIKKWWK